jgi:hypothetical protein
VSGALDWTIQRNEAQDTPFGHPAYTLYFRGLVRGHLFGKQTAIVVRDALNAERITVPLSV